MKKVGNTVIGQGMPKICAPVVERTQDDILEAGELLRASEADIIEWRGDFYEDLRDIRRVTETACLLKTILGEKPLLFTIRTDREGGEVSVDFSEYENILMEVAGSGGVDLIDVEMFRGYDNCSVRPDSFKAEDSCNKSVRKMVQNLNTMVTVIGSYHDFDKTPSLEEISARLVFMKELGADIPKIAVMPKSREDVMTLMRATLLTREVLKEVPLITMSMGGLGAVSRVAGESFGSDVTFGCVGKSSAPGQIEVKELKHMLELLHCADESSI